MSMYVWIVVGIIVLVVLALLASKFVCRGCRRVSGDLYYGYCPRCTWRKASYE